MEEKRICFGLLFELDCYAVDDVHLESRIQRLLYQNAFVTCHFQDLHSNVSAMIWLSIIAREGSVATVISQLEFAC